MNQRMKQALTRRGSHDSGLTLEGVPCSVGGWANDHATITPDFGGFWHADWETVKRVLDGDKKFTAADVRFHSWQWLGYGVEVPDVLKRYTKRSYNPYAY